jgi:HAD superfamily hydrolase (TIGR01509 family)
MTVHAVAWDIDGTLVDSEPVHLLALQKTCAKYNVDISDIADDHFIGVNVNDVWKTLRHEFPAYLEFHYWLEEINNFYIENSKHLSLLPGAVETVRAIDLLGITQVAVSNSNRLVVDTNLKVGELTSFMRFSLSLDDVENGKPDPEPYISAARKLDISSHNMIAIEDSAPGAASAKAAGYRVLGFGSSQELAISSHCTIETLNQILDEFHSDD